MTHPLFLVRHAQAGERTKWDGPDFLRPLPPKGIRQAKGLVGRFAGIDVERLISSPFVRCIQTFEPLAADRGLPIEPCDDLAEETSAERAVALLERLIGRPMALCSHGDVIEGSVRELISRGLKVEGTVGFAKGSIWELRGRDGSIALGRYIPPP
jgi:phosphohistidine phosphatase SixA